MSELGQRLERSWPIVLASIVAVIAIAVTIRHAGQPLLEWGMFRQTQTALTSYWMIHEGWQMPYQTPVAGYPWALPFELPIYQGIVALIVAWTGAPLDPTGRIVSFIFLLACAWPAFATARRLALPSSVAWLFCALLWSSPLYLFWGGTFLMETAAVFFAFAAVPYALDMRAVDPPWRAIALFALFMALGLLQKVTTAAPVAVVMGLVVGFSHLRGFRHGAMRPMPLAKIALAFIVPLAIGYAWTRYADHVRGLNFFGQTTTVGSQSQYYTGTIAERLNPDLLREIFWSRVFWYNAAGPIGIALLALALLIADGRTRAVIAVSLLLFALPILMFLQVHYFLAYYQTACVVFLVAALAVATLCGLKRMPAYRIAAPLVALILVVCNFVQFANAYGAYLAREMDATNTSVLSVGDVIRRYTTDDSAILVFGLLSHDSAYPVVSYSSEIAYYAQRKAFTVEDSFEEKIWNDPASYLGDKKLGAIIVCEGHELARYAPVIRKYDTRPTPFVFDVGACHVWLPNTDNVVLADGSLAPRTPLPN